MRHRNRTAALALAAFFAAATIPALSATAQTTAAAPVDDHAARLAVGIEIMTNLPVIRLLSAGAQHGVMQDPDLASLTPAEKARFCALIDEEIQARAPQMIEKLAQANVDRYTLAQLDDVLTLSKIKFFQDSMLAGGDPSLASPQNDVVTPSERDFLARAETMPYVADFISHIDLQPILPDAMEAVKAAVQRFAAEKAAAGKAG